MVLPFSYSEIHRKYSLKSGVRKVISNFVRQRRGAPMGQAAQVKNQKAVQELPQLGGLRLRQFQLPARLPVIFQKSADNLPRTRRQVCFLWIRIKAKLPQQFEFKHKNQLRRRFLPAKAIEKSAQQFENDGQRRFRFRRLLDKRGGVGGLSQFQNISTDCSVHFAQTNFTQDVQI
jgi:hypothetical protein